MYINVCMCVRQTPAPRSSLLGAPHLVLHSPAQGPLRRELLPDHTVLVQGSADLLRCTP